MSSSTRLTTRHTTIFIVTCIVILLISFNNPSMVSADPIVADHTCTDITAVPQAAIEAAKANLHIAYGHTSHGSQITTGMSGLVDFANNGGLGLSLPENIFDWNNGGYNSALDLEEGDGYGDGWMDHDAGYYPDWISETREYLDDPSHADVNVIVWSWCGQASGYTEQQMIDFYLAPMSLLEADYPQVTFVYMTGHADGSGETGNLHLRNQQIREYCITNDKVLFDFYDIECYDPDNNYYGDKRVDDACNYDSDGNGSRDRNWAIDWQDSHTVDVDWYSCSSAHSQALNANRKAYATWWLWARLAGWGQCTQAPDNTTAFADDDLQQITVQWTDLSSDEDTFIIQRQVNADAWDTAYAVVAANTCTFIDEALLPGIYRYRILAHRNDNGSGKPCDSGISPMAQAEIVDTALPAVPSDLTAAADSISGIITLTWNDTADNEEGFIIQRQVDGNTWDLLYDTMAADQTLYLDTGLTIGSYTYQVVATNSHGDSLPSNSASAYIVQSVPGDPTGLSATVNGFDINLAWADNSDNEDAFVIERRIDTGLFTVLEDDLALNTDTYTDVGLAPLHTYTYRIKAVNSFGESAWTNEAGQAIFDEVVTITLNNADTGEVVDAFLGSTVPDSNYGSTTYLTDYDRFILQFNLPAELMNKTIVSADLSVYVWAVDSTDVGTGLLLYPVTRAWDESSVTWNQAKSGTHWNTAGGDIGPAIGQLVVEDIDHQFLTPVKITDLVQQWVDGSTPNYGLILDKGPDVGMGIKASEYGQSASPYLTITYSAKLCTDLDMDGDVDGADLAQLIGAFNPTCVFDFSLAFGQ